MNILAAIRREEKKVRKQLTKLQHDLIGLQSAATALGSQQTETSLVPRSVCCQPQPERRFQELPRNAGQSSEPKQRRLSPNRHAGKREESLFQLTWAHRRELEPVAGARFAD